MNLVAAAVFQRGALACLGLALLWLAGCASLDSKTADRPWRGALPPAALGCAASVQQRLTVMPPGKAPTELEALLEVDAQILRMAIFHAGQRMGTLQWDGQQWDVQRSPWWPAQLDPAQVLSDMQLALWPLPALESAVLAPWRLESSASARRLLRAGQEQVVVRYVSPTMLEISYAQGGWTLRVESPGSVHLCPAAAVAP